MRFNPDVVHVCGKQHLTANALFRAPVGKPGEDDHNLVEEVEQCRSKLDNWD
jgi:hypothetical protein